MATPYVVGPTPHSGPFAARDRVGFDRAWGLGDLRRRAIPKVLYAEFTARPGCADEVAAMLSDLARDVRAEPGNVTFAGYRLEADPDKFFVYEVYADDDAFAAHISAPYGAPFNSRLNELIVEPHSMLTFLTPLG